ncbi:major facilitator superfamily MFS_1 [Paludibacter propionicigenes WB4]|uniref:Lysosomal dipeptide transporter MFSD1 n=1 Tax=Paludibacter propionicigenes (strain DSM 17365 / JCM 13257 / WB4) TaxID=694427 RepID=E4T2R1_PALPW|nr:MFS transporter [Paludibacter propionicigenes]ADQ79005.1 major facilitator superfamily MFS_1 [Paludibacter propionicigenes WB4]
MAEKISSLRESKSARWVVLILVSFTMMCMYYLPDAMAPLQQNLQSKLHWSATDYGLFTSGYGWFNVFLLMMVFSGMILDKLGTRFTGVLAIGIMLAGAGIKYWAIAGHVDGTYELTIGSWQVLGLTPKSAVVAGLGFALFGVGSEMFGIAANKAVVRWFRGKEMALAIGLNTSTGRIGTALAMFTPQPLYNLTKDVSAPVLLSIVLLCLGLLVYLFFNVIDKRLDKEESDAGIASDEEFKFSDIADIARNRAFWYISILCVLFYSAVFPFIKFATNLIVQKFSVTDTFAGYIPALLPFSALLLTPLFGGISDKKGKGASIMILGSILLVCVHLLFAIPSLNSFPIAIGLVVVLGIAFSLVPSAMWPAIAKIIPESKLGTAYAMTFWVQNWGLMLVPLLIGWVLDKYCIIGTITRVIDGKQEQLTQYNYTIPMLIFACFGVLAIGFAYLLKAEDKKKGYGLEQPNVIE